TQYEIRPEQFGFQRCKKEDLLGGDAQTNAEITRSVIEGSLKGPKRDVVLLNSGCALYIAKKARSIQEGIVMAAEAIDSGKAKEQLSAFIRLSNEV
ncbi:MAG TPA: anthranilate phosphoribosyltransferase, partial [Sphaerochaeta sp.]|nr:anthranilate phosphoribosyltransferase [Sphaerochaeta sp.]